MNLRGFEQDFTKDLESFVKRPAGWEPIIPLKTWSAKKTAAPERHKLLGFECGLSPQTQIHLLDNQNNAFEIIESMLRIYLNPIEYNGNDSFAQIDVEAEQVWLFAMRWLDHYYECLMEPLAIRTEFYRQSHVKFLELMRKMLLLNPKRRISFADALKFWYPAGSVFSENVLNEQDSSTMTDPCPLGDQGNPSLTEMGKKEESLAECHSRDLSVSESALPPAEDTQVANPDECHSPVPFGGQSPASLAPVPSASESVEPPHVALPAVASSSQSVLPSLPSVPQPVATSVRSRLALKRPDGPAGHNKTRRSPRNSGRYPAIGNRGTRARG
jgi:hypothetical protein